MRKKIVYVVLLMLVLISGGLFFLTHFFSSSIVAQDGYFVSNNTLEKNLISENKKVKNTNIKLNKMNSSDNVYSNLGKTYIGTEDKKTELNTGFPVFTNNGLAIVNINSNNKLINDKFEYFDTYENFTVTDGKVYNFMDLEQSDYEQYIFLELENGAYINLYNINLEKYGNNYHIPVNSIINFQENYIKFYSYHKNGKLIYDYIESIGFSDFIKINEDKYTYEDFLENIDKIEGSSKGDGDSVDTGDEEYLLDGTGYDGDYVIYNGPYAEVKYRKPEVKIDSLQFNVYSGRGVLRIADPAGTITGGVNFLFYIGDKLYSRKTFVSSGKINFDGLMPNTTYKVVGNYKYYNEDKKKLEVTFFNQSFTTGDYKSLPAIDLLIENGPVYSNKIEFSEIKIVSDLRNDALLGTYKASISLDDTNFNIPNATVKNLAIGKTQNYSTPPTMKSNKKYDYEIKIFDGFGNELNVINNKGVVRTSKEAPTATFKVMSNDVGVTGFNIALKNTSNVNISNYRYIIFNDKKEIVDSSKIDPSNASEDFLIKSLDPNSTYSVQIFADFDVEDGRGTQTDVIIGEGKFTTMPLSSLGYLRVFNTVTNVTYDSATINTRVDLETVSSVLLNLLSSFKVEILDENDELFYSITYGKNDLADIVAGKEKSIDLVGLAPVTTYKIVYSSTVTQGRTTESISVLSEIKQFKCLKRDAVIEITNRFVNKNMIDFDVRVIDNDDAIESNRVLLEVRDSNNKLIDMTSLVINGDFVQLTYTKLDPESKYIFKFYAEEYNVGFDNSTFVTDMVLLEEELITEDGISGTLEIQEVVRQITGNNLFNIRDFDRIRKEGNTSYKKYDLDNNAVMFGGKNGYVNFSYYLPEAYGKSITVNFKAKYDSTSKYTAPVYLSNTYNNTKSYLLVDDDGNTQLNKDTWITFTKTFNLTSSYVGFVIDAPAKSNQRTDVWIKDLQIFSNDNSNVSENYSYHPSNYVFNNAIMKAGNEYFESYDENSSYLKGNTGDGYARITNLDNKSVYNFSFTHSEQTFVVPVDGLYKIELWGASGGRWLTNGVPSNFFGGKGAYTSGEINLKKDTYLYIYVGGKGADGVKGKVSAGGYNGGGSGDWDHSDDETDGGGGGATDVRLVGGPWDNEESLKSRIMVAAGGGGASDNSAGGAAGAISSFAVCSSKPATQIGGYKFGIGQDGKLVRGNYPVAGGGGGYYGGTAIDNGSNYKNAATGGSSYISGYKGCISYNKTAYVSKVDTSTYHPYTEENSVLASLRVNIIDKKDEITNDDYYIRVFLDGNEISSSPYRYFLVDNKAINQIKNFHLTKNKKYQLRLSVKIRNRFYDLDFIDLRTDNEIRTIKDVDEFYNMHPVGKYVVVNDLDFSANSTYLENFYGEIDFQGHTIIIDYSTKNMLFHYLRGVGLLKNVVIDLRLNKSTKSWYGPFVRYNYGTIDNIIVNVTQSYSVSNTYWGVINYANYGTIKNFVINSQVPVHTQARFGMVTYSNQGLIKNGYVYGENIDANHESSRVSKDVGVIACEATTNSRISNVLSLITVSKDKYLASENYTGNLVGYANVGKMYNSLSVEADDMNDNLLSQDPNFGRRSSMSGSKIYFASKKSYNATLSSRISYLALYDKNFMEDLFNSDNAFTVSDFVSLGYYPQLKLNNCMPKQDWISLPKLEDTDLIDVTSVEELSNNGESAEVKLHLNNPAAERIVSVGIKDIDTVEILEQNDEGGKSDVIIRISNPKTYKSVYYLRQIVARGVSGFTYDVTYGDKDRPLEIALYRPITKISDWLLMKTYREDNFMLMNDIDFQGAADSAFVNSGHFYGVLNGAGHTIRNITVKKSNGILTYLDGKIINLNVENYTQTYNSGWGGFIYQMQVNSLIDNVHMTNVSVKGSSGIGGITGYNHGGVIINSSVNNFKADPNADLSDVRIGAIAGLSNNNGYISNCYANNVNIEVMDALSAIGIGGLVGELSNGSIMNCYATGKIATNCGRVGGIVGYSSALIANVWSNVNIYSELDYVGGIVGYRNHENMSSTLVFGPVYSSYDGSYINRTAGITLTVAQKNYFWDRQSYLGYVVGNASAEKPLTSEKINDIDTYFDLLDFTDEFSYEDIDKGILPKLKSTTGELLPNQVNNTYSNELFDVQGKIDVVQKTETGDIYFILDNPDNKTVVSVGFDYLRFDAEQNMNITPVPEKGYTIVSISNAYPTKYFDSYSLTKVYYKTSPSSSKTYSVDKHVKVDLKFYSSISSFTDWTRISRTTPENYRVTGVIDFANATNINTNLVVARLEGQGDGAVIRNMTFNNVAAPFSIIRKLTASMKNIKFENITININTANNATYGSYANIIRLNFADISGCDFENITIKAANVTNYAAPIGLNRGYDIRDVNVHNCHIWGKNYVSAFIASSQNYGVYNLNISDCEVYGTESYVGAAGGQRDYSNPTNWFYVTGKNLTVTGKSYVGALYGAGGADHTTLSDSTVTAYAGGTYIGGAAGYNNDRYSYYYDVDNVTVTTAGSNRVGGMFGFSQDTQYTYIKNSHVINNGVSNTDTGCFQGYKSGYSNYYISVYNCDVTSKGTNTGGLFGYFGGTGESRYNSVVKTTVNGVNKTGGAIGTANTSRFRYSTINVKVNSNGDYVGGVVGYMTSMDPTDTGYSEYIEYIILENADVTGKNEVGLFAGYSPSIIYDSMVHYIMVSGNVNATASNPHLGIDRPVDEKSLIIAPSLSRFHVYDKSKLNNMYITDLSYLEPILNIMKVMTNTNLKTQTYYTNNGFSTSYFSYTDYSGTNLISNGYYPFVHLNNKGQVPVKLPTGNIVSNFNISARLVHELPKLNVYSSGVNNINLEFENIDEFTDFNVFENNELVYEGIVDNRVYTFNYNYTSDIKAVLSDGVNSREYKFKAEDLINKVSTFKNSYAYIYDGVLKGNINSIDKKVIHIYGKYVLTEDYDVYNIESGKYISTNNKFKVNLCNSVNSLFNFELDDTSIDTYYNFSIIHKSTGDMLYEAQLFVKNGEVEIIDSALDNVKTTAIIDEYGEKSYVTVLGDDGIIYNLKDEIKLPYSFNNNSIKYMSNNISNDSNMVVVMYNSGKVVVFDYRTGSERVAEKATENISFFEYVKESIVQKKNLDKNLVTSYNDSLELSKLLNDKPLSVDSKGKYDIVDKDSKDNSYGNYVTYYNAVKNSYDVVDINPVVFDKEIVDEVKSENDKIYSSPELISFYMHESTFKDSFSNINLVALFSILLFSVIITLVLWFKNAKELKVGEK